MSEHHITLKHISPTCERAHCVPKGLAGPKPPGRPAGFVGVGAKVDPGVVEVVLGSILRLFLVFFDLAPDFEVSSMSFADRRMPVPRTELSTVPNGFAPGVGKTKGSEDFSK